MDLSRSEHGAATVRLRHGARCWRVRRGWQERLLGPGSPDWFALEADWRASKVKSGLGRSTYRVRLGDRSVFAKVVERSRLADRVKRRVIGDPAHREWKVALEAETRDVSVVRGLGVGYQEGPGGGRAVYVSLELPDAKRLSDAWASREQRISGCSRSSTAKGLIEAVARLFATSHERGFVHRDAHPDNILVQEGGQERPSAAFVDVHGSRFTSGPASLNASVRSLAQLDQYYHRRASRTERLRFLDEYLAQRPSLSADHQGRRSRRALLAALARERMRHARRLARGRDRRLHRSGKYFSTFALPGGWRATAALRLARRHVFPEERVPDRTEADWREILEGLVERIGDLRVTRMLFDYQGFQVEVSRIGGLRTRLRLFWGWSPARRVFEHHHKLRHRNEPGELILACGEHRRGGLVDAAFLVRPGPSSATLETWRIGDGGHLDGTDRDSAG